MKTLVIFLAVLFTLIGCSSYDTIMFEQKPNVEYTAFNGNQILACSIVDYLYPVDEFQNQEIRTNELAWELIYIGKENNFINVLYREYFSTFPGGGGRLNQTYEIEYKYDIVDSIEFKNKYIFIKSVDESKITYYID